MVYLVSNQASLFSSDLYSNMTIKESLDIINSWDVIQFDTETTGRDAHLCKVLCAQFGNKKADIQIVVDTTTVNLLLYKIPLEKALIVGQNLKFDLQFLYNYSIIPKRIYDTMIVEQLLYLGYPPKGKYGGISYALNEISMRYLGINIDKSTRGEIIWRGLDSKVIEYAANDVKYLEDIMQLQIKECIKKECIKGAKLECDFVPVIAYLEWCGIKLDESKWKEKMERDKLELNKALNDLNNFALNHPKLKKWVKVELQGDLFSGFNTDPVWSVDWKKKEVIEVFKVLGFDVNVINKKGDSAESVMEKHISNQKGIEDEFLKLYFKYQEFYKLTTSFGQGHLNAINPITGRIHTIYKQIGTISGRMSCGSNQTNTDLAKLKGLPTNPSPKQKSKGLGCSYPNMQQLPKDPLTRSCFVSEPDNIFCSCDYSAKLIPTLI